MRRTRRVPDVVDVERVDAHETGAARHQEFAGASRQVRVVLEVAAGAPMAGPTRVHKHRLPGDSHVRERVRAQAAHLRSTGVHLDHRDVSHRFERNTRQVGAAAMPVARRVHVGAGVAAQMQRGDQKLRLPAIALAGSIVVQ